MILYRIEGGVLAASGPEGPFRRLDGVVWDRIFAEGALRAELERRLSAGEGERLDVLPADGTLLAPIESQEVWAAGVTYWRSRTARMEESAGAGSSSIYDRVYHAHRPELFFKATAHRVVGHGQPLRLRGDSWWMVPEPELTLAFDPGGRLLGYTIGNDLSSRDIEGENPLYLPQAKTFARCAALGPGLLLTDQFPPPETAIELAIHRGGCEVFAGRTEIAQMKQSFENLREHLFRDNEHPRGCFLMTGTGVVPPDDFTLRGGDGVTITIAKVGTLVNGIVEGQAR